MTSVAAPSVQFSGVSTKKLDSLSVQSKKGLIGAELFEAVRLIAGAARPLKDILFDRERRSSPMCSSAITEILANWCMHIVVTYVCSHPTELRICHAGLRRTPDALGIG